MVQWIWTINAILQTGVLALVLWKRGWRQHPAFTIYIAYCACKTPALMWIALFSPHSYFVANSIGRSFGFPLMTAVLVEVFAAVFKPYSTLPKGTLGWYKASILALVFSAALLAIQSPPSDGDGFVGVVMMLNRSVSIMFCGAFSLTALFSSYFGIPWQTRTYGIGVGFLLFMSVDMFTGSLAAMYGPAIKDALQGVSMLGYSLAVITWIIYFAKPDIRSCTPTLEQLKRLQKALDYTAEKAESLRETI